jgi:23S rRNA (pseudouridine1915-N3)-methyltransferase
VSREYRVVWAGRHQRSAWESLCERYRKKIARHAAVRDQPIRVKVASDDPRRQQAEAEALLGAVPAPGWTIALDSGGKPITSQALADELTRLRDEWPHPVAFVIGSDLGLAPEVLSTAQRVLSFGPMTFNHELARLMLYEQLYRAVSIQAGISYHRERF